MSRLISCLLSLNIVATGCGAGGRTSCYDSGVGGCSADVRGRHKGAAVVGVYSCNELISDEVGVDAGGRRTLFSTVLGLSSIEVLVERIGGGYDSSLIVAPALTGCTPTPFGIAVLDVDSDNRRDVVVMDACRNWVALNRGEAEYSVHPLDLFFEGVTTATSSRVLRRGAEGDVLVTGGASWARGDLPTGSGESASSTGYLKVFPPVSVPVMNPFLVKPRNGDDPDRLLLQGQGVLALYDLAPDRSGQDREPVLVLSVGAVEPPYVRTFDGLDHLQLVRLHGCDDVALAVGTFSGTGRDTMRRIQLVTFSEDGHYLTHELITPFSVSTFGMTATADGRIMVGILGKDSQGDVFSLGTVEACARWTSVGTWRTRFDWRTPDAPAFLESGPRVPKTEGIRLLGLTKTGSESVRGETYEFTNYDGYVMRTWRLFSDDIRSGNAVPTLEEAVFHEERQDLAFVD